MNQIKSFFLICSGVTSAILQRAPSDTNKYVSIGATIFFTGLFAGLTGAYALYTVFNSMIISCLLGLVWGLMIFNLDRFIVMSLKIKKTFAKSMFQALPRIVLAIIIAIVIAKPLELKLFETEIQSEVALMRLENISDQEGIIKNRYNPQIISLNQEIESLQNQLTPHREHKDALQKSALEEADGTGGSLKRNMGPIYRAKHLEAEKAESEYNRLSTTIEKEVLIKRQNISSIEEARKTEMEQVYKLDNAGIATNIEALSRLSSRSEAIYWAGIFIMLLFIAIETAPIFVKLIANNSPYDYVLDHHELCYEENHRLKTHRLKQEIDQKISGHLSPAGI